MQYLKQNGYRCLNLTELFNHPVIEFPREKRAFALTFDDGYDDFFKWAFPVLNEHGFTATVFLVTDNVDGYSNWQGDEDSSMLTWKHIRELNSNGISFGSHTCTHAYLPYLTEDEAWHEIYASREILEMKLNHECTLFAYPFGESTPGLQRLVQNAGYKAALGARTGKPGLYNWWRNAGTPNNTLLSFSFKLTWYYNFYHKARGWLKEETSLGHFLRRIKRRWLSPAAQPM